MRHNKQWRKLTQVYVGHTSEGLSCVTASREWAIIGLPWCMTVLTIQKDAMDVNFMRTLYTNLSNHFIQF